MRSVLLPATALALLAFGSPDDNRRSRETGMVDGDAARSADSAPADTVPATPAAVLSRVYLANTSEIQRSKLAAKQASAPAVRRIAARLAADHTRNREQLPAAQNDQVRAYLQKTLTELEGHLAALQQVEQQVPA